jgi:putative heme-binding domain-containing protein
MKLHRFLLPALMVSACSLPPARAQNTNAFELRDGDRVVFLGDTFLEREQNFGFIEHLATTHFPDSHITFRNLGWSADAPLGVSRAGFDTPDKGFDRLKEQLALVKPTVAFLGYGMAASFDGDAALPRFKAEMEKLLDTVKAGAGTGEVRFVILSPIPHEKLPPPLPDPAPHNAQLTNYARALKEIAASRNAHFVDLLELVCNLQLYNRGPAFTDDGIHLNSYGHRRVAETIAMGLKWEAHLWRAGITTDRKLRQGSHGAKFIEFGRPEDNSARLVLEAQQLVLPRFATGETTGPTGSPDSRWQVLGLKPGNYDLVIDGQFVKTVLDEEIRRSIPIDGGPDFTQAAQLMDAIRKKNELFFYRYRPENNTYLFLFRKHEQGQNAKEIPQFDPLIEEQERQIALLRKPVRRTLELLPADASRRKPPTKAATPPDSIPNTSLPPPKFDLGPGLEINLFAENPLLAKPIQMNFDAQGRLWVASSEVYPQIKPGQVANDKIILLEDADGDGRAEKSSVFADGLLIPTGVEPGDGGCYVGQSTELLHLKDTDGDGRADQRRIVLSAFGTEDTHHILHTLRWGHDGQLYMNQSIYIHTHIETPHGVTRLNSGGILSLRPGTMEVGVLMKGLVNSWGHAFDEYGQSFATDGASSAEAWRGGLNWAIPQSMFLTYERARRICDSISPGSYPKFCGLELVKSAHFPDDWQGSFVTCDFRAHRIVRFAIEEKDSAYVTREMPDLVRTKDVAFRPIDIKLGPDGALYIADWSNPIIQHGEVDFRDPRRDHEHGRIWRVTYKDRALAKKPDIKAPVGELLNNLLSPDRFTETHSRRALLERGSSNVVPELVTWTAAQTNERARLQALWLYQGLDLVEPKLLESLLDAKDHRVRAAAVRVLALWTQRVPGREGGVTSPDAIANYSAGWPSAPLPLAHRSEIPAARALELLAPRVADEHPRVRVEALRALARIPTARAAELALTVVDTLSPPSPPLGAGERAGVRGRSASESGAPDSTDKYLDYALWLTINDLAPSWLAAVKSGAWKPVGRDKQLEFALRAIESARASEVLGQFLGDKPLPADGSGPWIDLIARAGTGQESDRLYEQVLNKGFDDSASARALAAVAQAIRARSAKPSPAKGAAPLAELFAHANDSVRLEAIRLAGAWKDLPGISRSVAEVAASATTTPALREAAFASLRELGGSTAIDTLAVIAGRDTNSALRRSATLALASLKLDRALAPTAELISSGGLASEDDALSFFRDFLKVKNAAPTLAKALPKSGLAQPVAKAGLRAAREGGRNEPELVLAFTRASGLDEGAATLTDAELKQLATDVTAKGDPARGEKIYRRKDLACVSCHAIGGAGGKVGPDMTSLGASAPVDYLIESVWFPNKKIKEGFHSLNVETKDGEEYTGTLARETGDTVVLRDASAREVSIAKNNITNRRIGTLSLMPAGLIDNLTADERIDLFRFLSELGKPGPYDASKANIARVWRIRPGGHTDEQRGEEKFISADPTGKDWTPVVANVDGQLPAAAINDALPPNDYARHGITALYAAARLEVAKAGPATLKLIAPADTALWLDGKAQKYAPELSVDLTTGPHTVLIRLDPKNLPAAVRLETSEGAFSNN